MQNKEAMNLINCSRLIQKTRYMRKSLPFASFLSAAVILALSAGAQNNEKFAYSITDVPEQNGNWIYLRKLNMETGTFSGSLINGMAENQVVYDAVTKKQITDFSVTKTANYLNPRPAFAGNVAAIAYDTRNNRIWYTPMFIDQLRYIDEKSMKVYYVTDKAFTSKAQKNPDQGNIVTRMTIAADGYGYAMTNDGTQLIRFSTNKKIEITDLGTVVDDPANKTVSIHNSCTSFGGDMIADDDGNLYVFSARNQVFKINIATKVATHLGQVSGLPNGFTINGAAVNGNNQVLISSAVESASMFVLDSKTWSATPAAMNGKVWHTSDLGSSNLLSSGKKPAETAALISRNTPANSGDGKISIFPNPVTNDQFRIQFNQLEAGSYTIQVTDVMGRQVIQQIVNVNGEEQIQTVKLQSASAKGIYLVKVTDHANRSVYSTKIVVQ